MYTRHTDQAAAITNDHSNPKRFPKAALSPLITASTDFAKVVEGASVIIHAVPAQHTPAFVAKNAALLPAGIPYVSTAKGICVATHELMSEAIPRALGDRATEVPCAYLSGPSFAKEMVQGHPMGVVVASHDNDVARRVQSILSSKTFRVYVVEDDVIGVEVGGALKNPLAIGAGMAAGLGFGQSTVAGLVTRGCREMAMLAVALGGRAETLAGLSGMGDLMLTCFSSLSRNNRFGAALARGLSVAEATEEIGEVVEGYPTAGEVVRLAKEKGLKLPLFFAVASILNEECTPSEALEALMGHPPGSETFPSGAGAGAGAVGAGAGAGAGSAES